MLSAFSSKASISDGMGCISAYGMGSLHVLEGTINAERYIKVLEQHMLPSRQLRRVRVLNWPACSPDRSPIENIWSIIK